MKDEEIDDILRQTLDDRRLSRGEKAALGALLADKALSQGDLDRLRGRVFAAAREQLADPRDADLIDWIEDTLKVLAAAVPPPAPIRTEAFFSPGEAVRAKIMTLVGEARRTVDVCVFTVTDNDLAGSLEAAHRRGVLVRLISDNDKAEDRGSDVGWLESKGVQVRLDRTPFHMHHKFAIFDRKTLLTGSYNWTRGAAEQNEENIITTEDPALVGVFSERFEELWREFAP